MDIVFQYKKYNVSKSWYNIPSPTFSCTTSLFRYNHGCLPLSATATNLRLLSTAFFNLPLIIISHDFLSTFEWRTNKSPLLDTTCVSLIYSV